MRPGRPIAIHEASHAIIAHVLGDYLGSVTIVPTSEYQGRASYDVGRSPQWTNLS